MVRHKQHCDIGNDPCAKWTATPYKVILNTNGGTINNGNVTEYTYGESTTLPTDVTLKGYDFKGWYDNEALTGNAVAAISATDTGAKIYYARWLSTNVGIISVVVDGKVGEITVTLPYGSDLPDSTTTLSKPERAFMTILDKIWKS